MNQVEITKSYFLSLYNQGMKVSEMAEDLSGYTGINLTPNDVKKLAEQFGLNLQKKPRKAKFIAVDDTVKSESNKPQSSEELSQIPEEDVEVIQ